MGGARGTKDTQWRHTKPHTNEEGRVMRKDYYTTQKNVVYNTGVTRGLGK